MIREALGFGFWLAGRAFGEAERLKNRARDAATVALLPLDVPNFAWGSAARAAAGVLRGKDPRPFLRLRNLTRNVFRELAEQQEQRIREHFERARERVN